MKTPVNLIVFALFVLCCCPPLAMAHKVTIFAYFEKDTLYSESYFSNGAPVIAASVTVTDAQGKELAQGKTDAGGRCNFPLPAPKSDLHLTLDASMGHGASFVLKMDEMTAPAVSLPGTPDKAGVAVGAATAAAASGANEVDACSALADDLRQIKRDLAKLQQRLDEPGLGQIFAGIGYILGLCGAAALVAARKK